MKRRIFLGLALLPAVSQAQQPPPLIGVMRVNARGAEQFAEPFQRDMTRLGWQEGRTYRTQFLWADGDTSRLPAMAAELLQSGARVLVTFGNFAMAAAQAATKQVPIVGIADDLVGAGLVPSMARPEGNTTGVSIMGHELNAKRLEILHEIAPQAHRIGVIRDEVNAVKGTSEKLEKAAQSLGLKLTVVSIATRDEIAPGLAALAAARVEAVQVLPSPFLNSQRATFVERIREMKLPAIYEWPETVEEGGLASYGPRQSLCFRHVAVLVSKVLHGAKPSDLPIEQPTTFTLAINTGAAQAIGLQVPETILLRADVVVD
jgi:putative tryptophan/tyrosine transport system substrate-binding protein